MHPVGTLLLAAASGRPPAPDGVWHRVPPWRPGLGAVLAFTGHAVLALDDDLADERLDALGVDGVGGAHAPAVVLALAGDGWIDALDVVLGARATGGGGGVLVARPDLADHPRARRASELRDDVEVLGLAEGDGLVVAIGRGLGGLVEVSVEVAPQRRGRGLATAALRAVLAAQPAGELVLVAVAPGNVASLRAALRAGFAPLASVQLFDR